MVAEPAGYVIYRTFEFDFIRDVDVAYYFIAFAVVLFRAVMVEIFCRIKTGKRLRVYRKSVCQGTHSGCAACAGRRIGDYTDA